MMTQSTDEVQELLKKCRVVTSAGNQISDDHLREIAKSSCKEWKQLPALLGLDSIVADDIGKLQLSEYEKRHAFLQEWKRCKGSKATYKQLVAALLGIENRDDAEKVCKLLKKSAPTVASAASIATPAASSSTPDTSSTSVTKNLTKSLAPAVGNSSSGDT